MLLERTGTHWNGVTNGRYRNYFHDSHTQREMSTTGTGAAASGGGFSASGTGATTETRPLLPRTPREIVATAAECDAVERDTSRLVHAFLLWFLSLASLQRTVQDKSHWKLLQQLEQSLREYKEKKMSMFLDNLPREMSTILMTWPKSRFDRVRVCLSGYSLNGLLALMAEHPSTSTSMVYLTHKGDPSDVLVSLLHLGRFEYYDFVVAFVNMVIAVDPFERERKGVKREDREEDDDLLPTCAHEARTHEARAHETKVARKM